MESAFKNALPGEVSSGRKAENPRELHTQADDEPPLTFEEARAAGMTTTPDVVYGDTDADPNREDQQFAHQGSSEDDA